MVRIIPVSGLRVRRVIPISGAIVRGVVPRDSPKISASGTAAVESRNTDRFFRKTRTDSRRLSFQNLRVRHAKPEKDIHGLLGELQQDLSSLPFEDVTDAGTSNAKHTGELAGLEELPLSPLMHPLLLQARNRHQEAKGLPSTPLNEFQRLLFQNPFARILATPVRTCCVTGAHLPASFLIPFLLERDPRTGKLWQLPTGFTNLPDEVSATEGEVPITTDEVTSTADEVLSSDVGLHMSVKSEDESSSLESSPKQIYEETIEANTEPDAPSPISPAPLSLSPAPGSTPLPFTLPKAYISSQLSCFSYMSSLKESQYQRLLPFRWKTIFGEQARSIVWRVDMADFVLSLLRKRVMSFLLEYSSGRVGYIVPYYDRPTGTEPVKDIAAVLWIPRKEAVSEDGKMVQKGVTPLPYSFLRRDGQAIPVFNMSVLLEEEALAELRRSRVVFKNRYKTGVVGIRRGKGTMRLTGMLWGLMSYMRIKKRELTEWTDVR